MRLRKVERANSTIGMWSSAIPSSARSDVLAAAAAPRVRVIRESS